MKKVLWLLGATVAALIAGLVVFVSLDARNDQRLRADSERKAAEFHKQFVEKEEAKADKVTALRIKALMKANPSWTQHDAEIRMLAEEHDARQEAQERYETGKSIDDIRRGCESVHDATSNKTIGSLTVSEARGIQACEALGLYH